ncbi:MAG: hypothetical protein JWL60_2062 [Gemmatimonadetes bacterium]|jgi:hypothetical protein|nr:hypothetical protein [Gemmatimonadota bacterium]
MRLRYTLASHGSVLGHTGTELSAARVLASMDQLDAMALRLHDDAGVELPTRTVGVTEPELTPSAFREVLLAAGAGSDPSLSAQPPFYLLVAGV